MMSVYYVMMLLYILTIYIYIVVIIIVILIYIYSSKYYICHISQKIIQKKTPSS